MQTTTHLVRDSFAMTREITEFARAHDPETAGRILLAMCDHCLDGEMPANIENIDNDAFHKLVFNARHAINRYDRCAENGKFGHLGAAYGKLGGRPPDYTRGYASSDITPIKNLSVEDHITDAIAKLAFGHTAPTHIMQDGRMVKAKYHPPKLDALMYFMQGNLRPKPEKDYTFMKSLLERCIDDTATITNTNHGDTNSTGADIMSQNKPLHES